MKFNSFKSRGFTLVELMIVIAIIGLLSGIIITSLTGSKGKSRDARRISDVNQIQLALEQYFDRCGDYPTALNTSLNNGCPSGIALSSYISVVPKDPSTNTLYDYVVNNGTTPTDYVIHTKLETSNAAQQNSYPEVDPSVKQSWVSVSCYGGNLSTPSNLLDYCVSTK